jgi:predicted DNA-binding transcriptional regulator YafY
MDIGTEKKRTAMTTEQAITRQMLLLKYLRKGSTLQRAIEMLKIDGYRCGRRTVERDMNNLRGLGINIEYSRQLDRYAITSTDYARNLFKPLTDLL